MIFWQNTYKVIFMIFMLLLTAVMMKICCDVVRIVLYFYNKVRISMLIENNGTKRDILYLRFKDYMNLLMEVFKRKGYKVDATKKCGEYGNGMILDKKQFVEVLKCPITHV